MRDLGLVEDSIYEIGTIEELDLAWQKLKENPEFSTMDKTGHRMYSSGFSCYRKFATGELFRKYSSIDVQTLDLPMKLEKPIKVEYKIWKRSGITRLCHEIKNLASKKARNFKGFPCFFRAC